MPYLSLLERLVRALPGATGAVLMDSEGEVVVETGARDARHRLVGAYQGIALATVRRTNARYAAGSVQSMVCRYSDATLILRPLKDGYFFALALRPEAEVGHWLHVTAGVQETLDSHL